jgi:hypothetical protein
VLQTQLEYQYLCHVLSLNNVARMTSSLQPSSDLDHGYCYAEDISDDGLEKAHETVEEDILMRDCADENPEPKVNKKAPRKTNQPKRRAVIKPELWNKHRSTIIELYIDQKLELGDVMDAMRKKHDFDARRVPLQMRQDRS